MGLLHLSSSQLWSPLILGVQSSNVSCLRRFRSVGFKALGSSGIEIYRNLWCNMNLCLSRYIYIYIHTYVYTCVHNSKHITSYRIIPWHTIQYNTSLYHIILPYHTVSMCYNYMWVCVYKKLIKYIYIYAYIYIYTISDISVWG